MNRINRTVKLIGTISERDCAVERNQAFRDAISYASLYAPNLLGEVVIHIHDNKGDDDGWNDTLFVRYPNGFVMGARWDNQLKRYIFRS